MQEPSSELMSEDEHTIRLWAEETFGLRPAAEVSVRMNVEVAELLSKLDNAPRHPADMSDEHLEGIKEEAADVAIMLLQIAGKLNFSLREEVDRKMQVNRNRKWGRTDGGRFQHIE